MTAGFVAFGVGVSLYAIELRSTLPGPAWTAALATSVATLGVAAFSLGSPTRDAVHGVLATIGYVTVAALPLLAARSFSRGGRKGWARASVAVAAVSTACLAATTAGPLHGLFQRAGLTVADGGTAPLPTGAEPPGAAQAARIMARARIPSSGSRRVIPERRRDGVTKSSCADQRTGS
jgi:hypothetical protein